MTLGAPPPARPEAQRTGGSSLIGRGRRNRRTDAERSARENTGKAEPFRDAMLAERKLRLMTRSLLRKSGASAEGGAKLLDMIAHDIPLQIGSLVFEGVDQIDLTGPIEILSRLPNATLRLYGKNLDPVRDVRGLRLMADALLAEAPQLDLLHVPGGPGQEALMDDEEVLDWIRRQAAGARILLSVCTGALICGAAGLLNGRRATTHWASLHLLPFFGAIPVNERVVSDGMLVSAAGVTAGLDGALRVAADLRGAETAQAIQLSIAYAPEPPFDSGSPESAPPAVFDSVRRSYQAISQKREQTARRVAQRLGTAPKD